ncbi:MAG: hypothetical protein COA84_06475 [Robiginitomaculum sp.]|nr:MAG: hypothetical protein COA84_06475 [Robiginitomaculum sp.]
MLNKTTAIIVVTAAAVIGTIITMVVIKIFPGASAYMAEIGYSLVGVGVVLVGVGIYLTKKDGQRNATE